MTYLLTLYRSLLGVLALLLLVPSMAYSQDRKALMLSGRITDLRTSEPLEGVVVQLPGIGLWTMSDEKGKYSISNITTSEISVRYTLMGYKTQTMDISLENEANTLDVKMQEQSLSLDEVVVTAQRRTETQTTSYIIDRQALNHSQVINLNQITTLLPGGKTVGDQNLATQSSRIALHARAASEMGNASFGTAIEVDGQRLENNAVMNETKGTDLRNVGTSNIESVEVVVGIPSVEYGDVSNGMVKINTRKGRTPFTAEVMLEPKTKMLSIGKGFSLPGKLGVLNVSAEHTRSVSDLSSPYTAYMRNNVEVAYSNTLRDKSGRPMHLSAHLSGNIGGFNSEADPDEFLDTYTKTSDNMLRGGVKMNWLIDRSWISNLSLQANFSYRNMQEETNANKSSASTQPYIHTTEQGYQVAQTYDENPNADIVLSPTGYWYVRSFTDSRPLTYSFKAKADWSRKWKNTANRMMLGAEVNGSGNMGQGLYYGDMRTAPTWREYRYDVLPFMNNMALFLEDKFSTSIGRKSTLHLTAGLRADMTLISNSAYGAKVNLSPRLNAKYVFWQGQESLISDLAVYGGWGRSVKQPSFAVLYPAPAYSDKLSFAPGTTADGSTFYAYYTQPVTPVHNPSLKWQSANQSEIGVETTIGGTRISLSAYNNKTFNPYVSRTIYTPYSYRLTTQADIETGCTIPSANRQYIVDKNSGIVTVRDITGKQADQALGYRQQNTFAAQTEYANGSPIVRRGIDWIVDFAQIRPLRTSIRIDGNFYHYKGLNQTIVSSTGWASASMDGTPYKYIGHYAGSSTASNGSISQQLNANLTLVTHIPKIRIVFSLRLESTLYTYRQSLSEYADGSLRGYLLESADDFHGTQQYGIYNKDAYVAVYPEYYTSWDAPEEKVPFLEKFIWARENDRELYQDLSKLVVKLNTSYFFNEERVTAYYAANLNVTKEIGNVASITFYARNFFYQMGKVKSSQTGLETSLYESRLVPQFYYGLSLRLKL